MSKEIKRIEAPNLIEFIKEIEQYVREGYQVTDTNEGIPQSWGPGLWTCELAKESTGAKPEKVEETPVEETPEKVEEPASEEVKQEPKKPVRKTRKSSK